MRFAVSTTLCCLVLVAPASAATDGVFIDPSSPSGKEYAIPLEQARRDAATGGGSGAVQPGERTAPLFGVGITERSVDSKGVSRSTDSGSPGSSGSTPESPTTAASAAPAGVRTASDLDTSDGAGPAVVLAGGGLGALLLAVFVGVGLRRRARATAS